MSDLAKCIVEFLKDYSSLSEKGRQELFECLEEAGTLGAIREAINAASERESQYLCDQIDRPLEPCCETEEPESWAAIAEWEESRADKAEAKLLFYQEMFKHLM